MSTKEPQVSSPPPQANRRFICAALGTSVAEAITFPLCTVKTVYQSNFELSIPEAVRRIYYGVEGRQVKQDISVNNHPIVGQGRLSRFYSGLQFGVASQALSTGLKYGLYRTISEWRGTCRSDIRNGMLNGAMTSVMASVITHPFEVAKFHYQDKLPYWAPLRARGVWFMYQGYSKCFFKAVVGGVTYFPINDAVAHQFQGADSFFGKVVLPSFCSAVISTLILQLPDFYRVRSSLGKKDLPLKTSFRGLSLYLGRVVPHFTILISVTQWLEDQWDQKT